MELVRGIAARAWRIVRRREFQKGGMNTVGRIEPEGQGTWVERMGKEEGGICCRKRGSCRLFAAARTSETVLRWKAKRRCAVSCCVGWLVFGTGTGEGGRGGVSGEDGRGDVTLTR
ncbi:hypothetical protein LIA77_08176 [Sarocladium implicatum]|nr:hypothetical protein LIA77_08176 [Sarocladium implicatum]